MKLKIRTIPNAKKTEFAGEYGDAIKIKVAAQAVDGKANKELIKFLSKAFGVHKNSVKFVTGETSRDKLLDIEGLTPEILKSVIKD